MGRQDGTFETSAMANSTLSAETLRRRRLFASAGRTALSLAALSLSGCASAAIVDTAKEQPGDDAALLTNLLGLETTGVAGYEAVIAGPFLDAEARSLAAAFAADHRRHAAALKFALDRLGGALPPSEPQAHLPAPVLSGRQDAIGFLVGIEQGLTLAHLGAVPAYAGKDLAKRAAGILGIEAMHWAVWRSALGEPPVPEPILG
jgi:hypothetical protein